MKLFKASNQTKIWRIDKAFYPTNAATARKLVHAARFIHLRVYFSLKEGAAFPKIERNVCYLKRANVYVFNQYLSNSPAVLGIIQEIECLQQEINYLDTTTEWALGKALNAASMYWH